MRAWEILSKRKRTPVQSLRHLNSQKQYERDRQPSKQCIAEWHPKTKEYAHELQVPVSRFDGDVCDEGKTLSSILEHMKDPAKSGEVMFISGVDPLSHSRVRYWRELISVLL